MVKRLGYILKMLKIEIPSNLVKRMKENIGKVFSLLDPSGGRVGRYDKEWLLILNIPKKRLLEWRQVY